MRVEELDYELPEDLIAQEPAPRREDARLLVLHGGARSHRRIRGLPQLLPESLIVVNDTRVIPARLVGRKPTGGSFEIFLVEALTPIEVRAGAETQRWRAMGRSSKPLRPGAQLEVRAAADGEGETTKSRVLEIWVEEKGADGLLSVTLAAQPGQPLDGVLGLVGQVPLPPYIRRAPEAADAERYQTVFAREAGAVAAPTAGLHFTEALVEELEAAGHRFAHVTLHVGLGTFAPVKVDDLSDHAMHHERYHVPEETAKAIEAARAEGRPVLAVGTTVVRTLEAVAREHGRVVPSSGSTDLFILPPYSFRAVDMLLTNFHLPKSTLLALVMAFAGVEPTREAYRDAVRERYRFFSYGDAMLAFPSPKDAR